MKTTAEVAAFIASQNERKLDQVPEFLRGGFAAVYIFNIYQKQHQVDLGSLGHFVIPACPVGEEYSEPLIIPGHIADYYDEPAAGRMAFKSLSGKQVALDVVGIGSYSSAMGTMSTNLEWWGVFIAEGEKPTKNELAEAKKKLTAFQTMWLQEGDRLALGGEKGLAQIMPVHREAVKWLNQNRQWAQTPQQMDNCPACGVPVKPGVAVCFSCNAIIDLEKAKVYFPERFAQAAKPQPAR